MTTRPRLRTGDQTSLGRAGTARTGVMFLEPSPFRPHVAPIGMTDRPPMISIIRCSLKGLRLRRHVLYRLTPRGLEPASALIERCSSRGTTAPLLLAQGHRSGICMRSRDDYSHKKIASASSYPVADPARARSAWISPERRSDIVDDVNLSALSDGDVTDAAQIHRHSPKCRFGRGPIRSDSGAPSPGSSSTVPSSVDAFSSTAIPLNSATYRRSCTSTKTAPPTTEKKDIKIVRSGNMAPDRTPALEKTRTLWSPSRTYRSPFGPSAIDAEGMSGCEKSQSASRCRSEPVRRPRKSGRYR